MFDEKSKRLKLLANIAFGTMFLVIALLAVRLYFIQVKGHDRYSDIQEQQIWSKEEIPAPRGNILDASGRVLATSAQVNSLFADPKEIEDPRTLAWTVSDILKLDYQTVLDKMTSPNKRFEWIKRKLSSDEYEAVARIDAKGLGFRREYKRFYPNGALAANLLGCCDIDDKGLEGIECQFDQLLAGKPGYRMVLKDAFQHKLPSIMKESEEPVPGNDLVLTLDINIQYIADSAVFEACGKYNPLSASAVVIEPFSGKVLAISNYPSFDPNYYSYYPPESRRNRAITDPYEPGSTFKPFVAAIALQENLASPTDKIFCENGAWRIQHRTLHDHKAYGTLTFHEVLTKSSNIGMGKIGMACGKDLISGYLGAYEFGMPTGIGLMGEDNGIVTSYAKWSYYTTTSVPMGHEIAVTPLQLAKGYSVFANGGYLVRPQIVQRTFSPEGAIMYECESPQVIRRIFDTNTTVMMTDILEDVIVSGTGKKAKISVPSAGKTGTTKKLEPNGVYSSSRYIASFAQYAPADNPRLLVLVAMDEPKGAMYGGDVAAPVAAKILQLSLDYLSIAEICQRK